MGRTRYKEFAASPEGIPTNILAERLKRLVTRGIAERLPDPGGGKRQVYGLTEKGEALKPIVKSLVDWGLEWEEGTEARMKPIAESP